MAGDVTTAQPRDVALDVARGFAIALVVFGHNSALASSWPPFVHTLFLFHVPLFFLMSGFVQRPQPLGIAARTLAVRLLVPFFALALVVGLTKCFSRGLPVGDTLLGIAWGTGQTLPWSHLWFLPALFVTLLALQALRRISRTALWGVVLIAGAATLLLPFARGPGLADFPAPVGWPWSLDLLPACLTFAALGALLREWPKAREFFTHPAALVFAVLCFAAGLGAVVDLNMREFAPPALALLAALAGSVLTLALSGLVARTGIAPTLALVGRHTMVIFLFHVSIQKVLLHVVAWPPSKVGTFVFGLAAAAATIVICLALSMLWDLARARFRAAPRQVREVTP